MKNILKLIALVFIFSCSKENEPIVHESKGMIEATINNIPYSQFYPNSNYSTVVEFIEGTPLYDCKEYKMSSISIGSWLDKISPRLFLSNMFRLPIEVSEFNITKQYHFLSYNPCINYPTSGLSFGVDFWNDWWSPNTEYFVDSTRNNIFKISKITDTTIEGSFDIKFIEKNIILGRRDPSTLNAQDTIHIVCDKFVAIR